MKKFTEYFLTGRQLDVALAELGYRLRVQPPFIPESSADPPPTIESTLHQNMSVFALGTAKREAIVAPILSAVAYALEGTRIEPEATVVSELVGGTVDYWVSGRSVVLVVEAKNHDIDRGLGQLSAELIASVAQPDVEANVYGVVTSGNVWRFAMLDEAAKTILVDEELYYIPLQVAKVFKLLHGILGN